MSWGEASLNDVVKEIKQLREEIREPKLNLKYLQNALNVSIVQNIINNIQEINRNIKILVQLMENINHRLK
ncbi:hypothetical protein J7M00_01670 [bacterium]|nr:hypothetical protein [bacterium]